MAMDEFSSRMEAGEVRCVRESEKERFEFDLKNEDCACIDKSIREEKYLHFATVQVYNSWYY